MGPRSSLLSRCHWIRPGPTRSSHPRVAFTMPTPLTPRPLSAASCLCRCVRHHPRRTALARSVLSGTHVTYARRQLEVLTARLAGLAMQRALPAPALRLARHVGCLAAGSSAFLTRGRPIVSFIAPLQRCSSDLVVPTGSAVAAQLVLATHCCKCVDRA